MKTFIVILICSLFMSLDTKSIDETSLPNEDIICPDGVSMCTATETCCISTDGDYSCCPIQTGVCCADHIHCCPEHYKCDLKIFKCDRVLAARIQQVKSATKKN